MSDLLSRRRMLKTLAIGAGTVVGLSTLELQAAAAAAKPAPAGLPHLEPSEPAAKALGYHSDATKVDAKADPMYKPGEDCANCVQLQGKAGDAFRPCNLFPGKLVSSKGWCKVYARKA